MGNVENDMTFIREIKTNHKAVGKLAQKTKTQKSTKNHRLNEPKTREDQFRTTEKVMKTASNLKNNFVDKMKKIKNGLNAKKVVGGLLVAGGAAAAATYVLPLASAALTAGGGITAATTGTTAATTGITALSAGTTGATAVTTGATAVTTGTT